MGKPVLASNVGGMTELLGDAGQYFTAGNTEALADACIEMGLNGERRHRVAAGGQELIKNAREWRESVRRYSKIYNAILQ